MTAQELAIYLNNEGFAALSHGLRTGKVSMKRTIKFMLTECNHMLSNEQYYFLTKIGKK